MNWMVRRRDRTREGCFHAFHIPYILFILSKDFFFIGISNASTPRHAG
jgi:hypothetical protein